jgi:hypothetical protein
MFVNSSQEEGGEEGVWLQARILNSLVFSFSTTVRAIRDSLRDEAHVCSASLRIIGSVSVSGTPCSKVSSADTDCVAPVRNDFVVINPSRQLVETHAIAAEVAFESW